MRILRVRKLNQPELEQIVSLHYQVLDESFLNKFGKNFLRIAYRTNVLSKNNIAILVKEKKDVIGFLIATKDGDKFNQEIIAKNFFKLSWEIFKASIFKPQLALKVIQWKLKPSHAKKIKPELQFIAIDPKFQSRGLGTRLLRMLSKEFSKTGIKQYRVGTKSQNRLSNRFYRKLGFTPFYKDNLFGDDFNYYLSKSFNRNNS